jgi:hypothetical protein
MTGDTGLRRFVGRPGGAAGRPGEPAGAASARTGRAGEPPQPGEHCGLCAKPIAAQHGHVADLEQATLLCACRPCYLLFTHDSASARYRAVPGRYLRDPSRTISAADWDQLDIPVGTAFFLRSTQREEVCGFYPSPAGATECALDLHAWRRLAHAHPLFGEAEPDVEAILICRTDGGIEYFLVPIDACYELAGRMRLHWRGFDGGAEARASIEAFLADVRARAEAFPVGQPDG